MAKFALSDNKVIAGVCGGVANLLNVDAKIVRIVWVIAVLFGGVGVLAYLLLWIVGLMQKK
ncbi:MAG: PspC domain-containing protein [Bacteroidaceae bacterium]|nr:PspC domain-containing protein [Bacteroidaceae bacterium]